MNSIWQDCLLYTFMNVSEIFKKFLLELLFSSVLVSAVQQSESVIIYTCVHSFFLRFFSHISHYRVLSRVPCAWKFLILINIHTHTHTGKFHLGIFQGLRTFLWHLSPYMSGPYCVPAIVLSVGDTPGRNMGAREAAVQLHSIKAEN